jgi:hypothetical protein
MKKFFFTVLLVLLAWAWYRTGWDDGFNAYDSVRIARRGGS